MLIKAAFPVKDYVGQADCDHLELPNPVGIYAWQIKHLFKENKVHLTTGLKSLTKTRSNKEHKSFSLQRRTVESLQTIYSWTRRALPFFFRPIDYLAAFHLNQANCPIHGEKQPGMSFKARP